MLKRLITCTFAVLAMVGASFTVTVATSSDAEARSFTSSRGGSSFSSSRSYTSKSYSSPKSYNSKPKTVEKKTTVIERNNTTIIRDSGSSGSMGLGGALASGLASGVGAGVGIAGATAIIDSLTGPDTPAPASAPEVQPVKTEPSCIDTSEGKFCAINGQWLKVVTP